MPVSQSDDRSQSPFFGIRGDESEHVDACGRGRETIMKAWPNWTPGQELRAEHLFALEDYLLTRASFVDEAASGLDSYDVQSTRVEPDDRGKVLIAGPVRGVTAGGQPVVTTEPLTAPIPHDAQVVDVVFAVNAAAPAPKVSLRVSLPEGDQVPDIGTGELYAGRYAVRDGVCELLRRAKVRRLYALQPHDAAWERWTAPLTEKLSALIEELEAESGNDARRALLLTELLRLQYLAPSTPLPVLARGLRMIAWLRAGRRRKGVSPHAFNQLQWTFAEADGEDIPVQLSRMLDDELIARRSLEEIFEQLLWPVYLHVPTADFREWIDLLRRVAAPSADLPADVLQDLSAALQTRLELGPVDEWTRAVALTTMAVLSRYAGISLADDLRNGYSGLHGGGREVQELSDCLSRLYEGSAQAAPAGPLAFSLIMQAVTLLPEASAGASERVRTYAAFFEREERFGREDDRVAEHVRRRSRRSTEPKFIAPGPSSSSRTFLPGLGSRKTRPTALSCVVVGLAGVGKTTMLRSYLQALEDPNAPRTSVHPYFNPARRPSVDPNAHEILEGEISLSGGACRLALVDVNGRGLSPGAAKVADEGGEIATFVQNADLLVLAIDALTVDQKEPPIEVMRTLTDLALLASRARREVMVAIVYTKADEYGALSGERPRLISTAAQMATLDSFQKADNAQVHDRWRRFLTSIGTDDDAAETRRTVVDKTRYLWESLVRTEPAPRFVNGYFIAADPADGQLIPWSRRGLLQLFADFYAAVEARSW
jgi:hypothetical protein